MQMGNMSAGMRSMNMEQNKGQLIMDCPLFKGISLEKAPDIMELLHIKTKTYKRGDHIINLGETINMLGIVADGEIDASFYDENGSGIIMRTVKRGGIFADSCAIISAPSMVQVVALKQCRIAWFDIRSIFFGTYKTEDDALIHQILLNMMEILAQRNMFLNMRTQILAQKNIRNRLRVYLRLLSVEQQCGRKDVSFTIQLPFNRRELASFLAVNRSALSREISHLSEEGFLDFDRDAVVVLNPAFLDY